MSRSETAGHEAKAQCGPGMRRVRHGLWWAGRLFGAAFFASALGTVPILLQRHVSGWLTGEVEIESVGEAVGQLIMIIGFGAPFAGLAYGLLPAFAAGLALLVAAIRNEGARHVALWAAAGVAVAWFALSRAIEEIDIFAWATVTLGGAAGGAFLRKLLSPGGRFDEARNRPAKPGGLERWGYAILSGAWPIGILALGSTMTGGGREPFILAIDALLALAFAMILIGRRRRTGTGRETPLPSA